MIRRTTWQSKERESRILVIGPSPPPYGGARISFELFWKFLDSHKITNNDVTYLDLPVRYGRNKNPPGGVNHFATLFGILRNLLLILKSAKIIVFGSYNFCFSYGILLIALCRAAHIEIYLRLFGGHPFQELKRKSFLTQNIALYFLEKAKKLVVETQTAAAESPQVLQKKLAVIPAYRFRSSDNETFTSKRSGHTWKFVYVGRISQTKGVVDLFDAYDALVKETDRPYELHIYGELASDMTLKGRASGIVFHGTLPNSEILAILSMYDGLVFPSKYSNEGHPGVLVEAFMTGLPVIATELPTVCEMIVDGKNGILINPGDVEQLKAAMFKLSHDSALRLKLSRASQKSFAKYDAELLLPKLAKTFGLSCGS